MPENQPGTNRVRLNAEKIQVLAEPSMIAFLRFLDSQEIIRELLLGIERHTPRCICGAPDPHASSARDAGQFEAARPISEC
jgi:hypothetical protein